MLKKYLIAVILSFALFGCCFIRPCENKVFAQNQNVTYVAFGDSIAEGYAINLKTKTDDETLITGADDSYAVTENCYVDLVSKELSKSFSVEIFNYAYSGDTCQDLLDFLCGENGFYDSSNNTVKNGENNNERYASLTNLQVYESVKNANIITICIGANNILQEASTLIPQFLGISSESVTRAEMEQALEKQILGDKDSNIKGFQAEFNQLLNVLNDLNPNAKIYFTNVYNPYKSLILDTSITSNSLVSMILPKLTQANLDTISDVTELAIAGGIDSSGENFVGINNVIEESINNFNQSDNFNFVDGKTLFDAKYNQTNRTEYNQYVNTQLEKLTMDKINFNEILNDPSKVLGEYIDPHPTAQGHRLIFDAHKDCGLEVSSGEVTVSFVTNCQTSLSSKVLKKGTQIAAPDLSNPNHVLVGWYIDEQCTIAWDFSDPVTTDLTLFAKWEKTIFDVTFDYNGGKVGLESQNVISVNKNDFVRQPTNNPIREDYSFVGWFADQNGLQSWDFENNRITDDVTIYACWEVDVYIVTIDYNGGTLDGKSGETRKVQKGKSIEKPETDGMVKTGYKFCYWFTENSQTELNFPYVPTKDETIFAFWKEAVTVNVYAQTDEEPQTYTVFKNTKLADIYNQIKPQKYGTVFLNWYSDKSFTNKLNADSILSADQNLYARWAKLSCDDEGLLNQSFSPTSKNIQWHIDANKSSRLKWQVNGDTVYQTVVDGDNGATWTFKPENFGVGSYEITCLIDDEVVIGKTVNIIYGAPKTLTISASKTVGKKTYFFEVDNKEYYDSSKFVWFKTKDDSSNDFSQKIGSGTELRYTFTSDCKVCVMYLEYEGATDGITSNALQINVQVHVDVTVIALIAVATGITALIVVGMIIRKKKIKNYY